MALYGGCRCGACRFTLAYDLIPITYACHCLDCQTMSGSGFALQALVPLSRFAITGDMIEWVHRNSQGKATVQRFCANCKARLYSTNEARPNAILLRAGALDNSSEITPAVHMWVKRKQPWIGLPADAEAYDEAVPADRAKMILAANFA